MRFYCPQCWQNFERDEPRCPYCGLNIEEFWKSKGYIEKLILALQHPEKETPIRAAWLLGQLKDTRAVPPLVELIKKTEDVYIARAAVQALGEIDTPEARKFMVTLTQHHIKMVRDEVQRILSGRVRHQEPEKRKEQT